MSRGISPAEANEIGRCKQDRDYFIRNYLKIVTKEGKTIHLEPNEAQRLLLDDLQAHLWIYVLKARQLGASTIIGADAFWRAMFTPNFRVLVVAHRRTTAEDLFEKVYKTFYDNLPPWMARFFRLGKSNRREIRFWHKGLIRVTTANSDEARGGTYNHIHGSEMALYSDFPVTLAAIANTAAPGARILWETTANGPNDAYHLWYGTGDYKRATQYHRRFLGFALDADYRGRQTGRSSTRYAVDLGPDDNGRPQKFDVDFDKEPLDEQEAVFAKQHGLGLDRMAWVRLMVAIRCAGQWNTFLTEYPPCADVAFVLGGRPYFAIHFADVMGTQDAPGLHVTAEPAKFHTYTLGVDGAAGSPDGSWCAATVLDVSIEKQVRDAATLGGTLKPLEFADQLCDLGMKYNAALINVEANHVGVAIIEQLVRRGYPNLYIRTVPTKIRGRLLGKVGWHTGETGRYQLLTTMQEMLSSQQYAPRDARIQRAINNFVYNERGRPEHATGQRDDFIFSAALALVAMEQAVRLRQEQTLGRRPETVWEIAAWELAAGQIYGPGAGNFAEPERPAARSAGLRDMLDGGAGLPPWSFRD